MKRNLRTDIFWISFPLAMGFLSGFFSREGTKLYGMGIDKPPLSPPAIVFPVVWTVLYTLMGIGAALIAGQPLEKNRTLALNVFVTQLVVNFFWSLIFFNAQAYGFAFVWLLILLTLVILMAVMFFRQNKTAGLLQIPYILWLVFAAYLNYSVWKLNG